MSGRKNILVLSGLVLSAGLLIASLTAVLVCRYYSRMQFDLLNGVCSEVLEQEPDAERYLFAALKEYTSAKEHETKNDVLSAFGYRASDFVSPTYAQSFAFAAMAFFAGCLLFAATFLYRNKQEGMRIRALTRYLEDVNLGKAVIISASGEDDFAKLEDEVYKTVTFLYQTKNAAVQAKDNFAKNLSNIAHQIKTPITAISLSVQTLQEEGKAGKIQMQLARLTRLQESLLVLAALDAGTLVLKRDEVDVFTVLVLAADGLQELLEESGTSIDIPELGEMAVSADFDWTMEAVGNLMKNCMEHNPGGTIHCSYGQNSLYTGIFIRDEGDGFVKEDIPHLFERFYRGRNAAAGGIGIGLALAKEIMERQNGTIRAVNMPEGGACFEIRFYRR